MRKWIVVISMTVIVTVALGAGVLLAQSVSPAATPDATPWLGVGVIESNKQIVIEQVQPGSPAATAQLAVGDIIASWNGTALTSISDLSQAVFAANSGDTVALDLLRSGKPLTVSVTLANVATLPGTAQSLGLDPLVVTGSLLSAQFSAVASGYQVTALNATANPFKLQVGDVVTTIDGQIARQLNLTLLQQHLGSLALPLLTIKVMRAGVETTLQGAPPVGSLNVGRPGGQEDTREGGHRDDQNGGEGGGEGGGEEDGGGRVVAPILASPTPQIQPESTLPADAFTQI